ncbi:MAG: hypothetical protein Q8O84_05525 [Nanoarchaeota archaeon]|nr:hypothetical protein [Nanoarchaeota archaeon]
MITLEEINKLVQKCLNERKMFHSEADFQHSLAWKIHEEFGKKFKIRLEFVIESKYIDIVLIDSSKNKIGIELKYKTKEISEEINGEQYFLKPHGAQDCGRYDVIKDIERLEELVIKKKIKLGFVIFLTNDISYLYKCKGNACKFSLEEGKEINGEMNWGKDTGMGTKKGREKTLELKGKYKINWIDSPNNLKKTIFKYFILEVYNK